MPVRLGFITLDCADTKAQAEFWSAALGYENKGGDESWAQITAPEGSGPNILFQGVPEGKPGKNRVHFDLSADDFPTELARLIRLGAKRASGYDGSEDSAVLIDPEGNEFCVGTWET